MLHACFYTICLVFRYTLWHFYAFSGTNLLTRCHSAQLNWLWEWMYNPGTQVQIPADANVGSYYLLKKLAVGVSPTAFLSKKKTY
jgi:hypothetical protein